MSHSEWRARIIKSRMEHFRFHIISRILIASHISFMSSLLAFTDRFLKSANPLTASRCHRVAWCAKLRVKNHSGRWIQAIIWLQNELKVILIGYYIYAPLVSQAYRLGYLSPRVSLLPVQVYIRSIRRMETSAPNKVENDLNKIFWLNIPRGRTSDGKPIVHLSQVLRVYAKSNRTNYHFAAFFVKQGRISLTHNFMDQNAKKSGPIYSVLV